MQAEEGLTTLQTTDGAEFTFRPSFVRLGALGSPEEILALLTEFGKDADAREVIVAPDDYQPLQSGSTVVTARYVASGLADDDASRLIGWHDGAGWHEGELSDQEVIFLAAHLLRHGLVGKPMKQAEEAEPVTGFEVQALVAAAQVHLGLSAADAEQLSMSQFQSLWLAKFPPEKPKIPSRDEYEEQMRQFREWRNNG